MTEFQSGVLSLIQAALTDTEPTVPSGFDYAQVYELAERQQIVPLVYYGALKEPSFAGHKKAQAFFERSCVFIGHSADQLDTVKRICDAFEANGIAHMPLKGTLLKPMYPCPEMRAMGDADILVRVEEYDRIKQIMLSLHCVPDKETDHEYSWYTQTGLQIELHKRLIPSYNEDYYAYYGDGWQLAKPVEGYTYRYGMSPEDMFIYLFTHFAKHYRDQGVGLKYVVDFFVYKRHYPELDVAYVEGELENLQLVDFYENIMHLLDVWFAAVPSDEMADYLTDKIFNDGVFGRPELNAVSEGLKLSKSARSAKTKKKWRLFFPPYDHMCNRYPILQKWAILLPILWIVRLFDVAFNHQDRYRRQMERLERMTDENIGAYQRELNYVGLDFNFGENNPPKDGEA